MSEKMDSFEVEKADHFRALMKKWCIPRLPGSEGSYLIVERLEEDFKELEFIQNEQKFPVFKSDTTLKLGRKFLYLSIMIAAFLLLFWFAFLISLIMLIPIGIYLLRFKSYQNHSETCAQREEKQTNPDEKIDFYQTNLIYRLKPKKEVKKTIILIAHHDSKSQTFPTEYRVYFALSIVSIFLFMLTIYFICIIFELIGINQHTWLRPLTFVLGWINTLIFLTLSFNKTSNDSPGALDNASGLYILWRTGNEIQKAKLMNTEVWLILTGAEEIGQIGAAEFLNEYREEFSKSTTYIMNFEMVGLKNTDLQALRAYSFPKMKILSPFLLPLAKKAAKSMNIDFKGWYLPIGANTDGILFRKEGYKAIDFVTKKAGKYTHLKKDDYNLIDPDIIETQVELNLALMRKLDEEF
ncbi:MAG: M28 family peptidase [Candidatus Lokiarchaeota archaeon]|nr:M28 family peptidase [Candidatus Lokiarchaeota archaeon]MBD3201462.1 M28 family peptidase [Candidatus Lokiarchaeota archaeon]